MPTINREGVSIYYERCGDSRKKPTILLSHGYSATSAMWAEQIRAFGDRYNIITWDMRGHGQTDSPDDPAQYSERLTVDDMAAILDTCGVDKAIIGGLSLGGYMTIAFHVAWPERCHALMLFDTGPGYKNAAARQGWNETAEARAKDLEARGLEALGTGNEVRVASHRSAQGLAFAARGMLAQVDDRIIQSLPGINIPVLVLVGEEDSPFRVPTDYMAAKLPGATKAIIPAAGHASNIDQPAAFNKAVLKFVDGLEV